VGIACRGLDGQGAVANVALRQARELARRFRVLLMPERGVELALPGCEVQPVRSLDLGWLRRFAHAPREYAFASAAAREAWRWARRGELGALLCHAHSVAALAARPRGTTPRIPCALVTHGDIFDRPRGTYDARLTALYRWVTPRAYRGASLVVALSPHMARLAIARGAEPGRVRVIPNGIAAEEFGLEAAEWQPVSLDGPLRILYVGRLAIEKGVDLLIDACRRLANGGHPFCLEIVGTGPDERALRERVAEGGISDRVRFVGTVPRQSLAARYLACQVVSIPSRSDTLPTVALEAGRAGRAVVASAVGGLPFLVADGETGCLVPGEDPAALADALAALIRDREPLAAWGRAAWERTPRLFDWEVVGESLAQALGELCGVVGWEEGSHGA